MYVCVYTHTHIFIDMYACIMQIQGKESMTPRRCMGHRASPDLTAGHFPNLVSCLSSLSHCSVARPPHCSFNPAGPLLPRGLCTSRSLCLNALLPDIHVALFFASFVSSPKCHLFSDAISGPSI